jgi:hypothetical protein
MAIRVFCNSPRALLTQINAAVRERSIETWEVDRDGDFTHSPEQWKDLAWFRPVIEEDKLVFNILGRTNLTMSKRTYGVYHGRFIEMLLTHFDIHFTRASATALPVAGDILPAVKQSSGA